MISILLLAGLLTTLPTSKSPCPVDTTTESVSLNADGSLYYAECIKGPKDGDHLELSIHRVPAPTPTPALPQITLTPMDTSLYGNEPSTMLHTLSFKEGEGGYPEICVVELQGFWATGTQPTLISCSDLSAVAADLRKADTIWRKDLLKQRAAEQANQRARDKVKE